MKKFEVNALDPKRLAKAFSEIKVEISEKQLDDLRELYDRSKGVPTNIDVNNRPQGPTIHTCKSVGTKLKKNLGEGPPFGMSLIGYINEQGYWAMRDNVRAALNQLAWFGPTSGLKSNCIENLEG